MDENKIREIVQQEIQKSQLQATYGVSKIASHTHNNIDSPPVRFLFLSDVPKTYNGEAGRVATVNADETGLEFTAAGSGNPAGNDGEFQYNNAGAFGASTDFVYRGAAGTVGTPDLNSAGVDATDLNIRGGDTLAVFGANMGASVNIQAGAASNNGGLINILGGEGGVAGDVVITGGTGTGGGSAGGNVRIDAGAGTTDGQIIMANLPVADPGIPGALYNSSGTVMVSL